MPGPAETREPRFWVLLLVVCAVSAVVGTLLGQLFGLAGVGVTVVLIALIGLVFNWRSRQRR